MLPRLASNLGSRDPVVSALLVVETTDVCHRTEQKSFIFNADLHPLNYFTITNKHIDHIPASVSCGRNSILHLHKSEITLQKSFASSSGFAEINV